MMSFSVKQSRLQVQGYREEKKEVRTSGALTGKGNARKQPLQTCSNLPNMAFGKSGVSDM
jgi:hypothetical protein